MSGCCCGQAGSMFCDSCSNSGCSSNPRNSYYNFYYEKNELEIKLEKEEYNKYLEECKKEKEEFFKILFGEI